MKRSQAVVLAAALAWIVTPDTALAKQTYLSCVYGDPNSNGEQLEIVADDGAGKVAIYVPTTQVNVSYRATFSPKAVEFHDRIGSTYEIDRSNLSFAVTKMGIGRQTGRCKLTTPPKRAF